MSRLLSAVVVACAVGVLVGCGGSTTGASAESGASLVRSGALAYLAVDSDLGSSQWQQVDKLLSKFPGRDKWLRKLEQAVADQGVDYHRDIKDALGPEVDIAVAVGGSHKPSYALLTKPDSIEKARALVRKLDEKSPPKSATRVVDGWFVVSDTEQEIDAVLKASGDNPLAGDASFKDAMAELPSEALVKAYVNGAQLANYLGTIFGSGFQTTAIGGVSVPFGLDTLDWISASLQAKGNGLRLDGNIKAAGSSKLFSGAGPYASKLISGVPADSFAFLTFHGGANIGAQLDELRSNPLYGQVFGQVEKTLGVSLDQVFALFGHEVAFYVRRGAGLPEFSLVLEAPDTERALRTVDRLATAIARLTHSRLGSEREGGIEAKTLTYEGVTIRWAGFDGRVLISSGPTGISDYRGSGDKLSDSSAYRDALAAAAAPDKTGGLIYLNLRDGIEVVRNYLGLSGATIPAELEANLEPLQEFVAYGTGRGSLTKFAAFLELK